MGVEVRQLTEPLGLDDFHPYGEDGGPASLASGTYWITLAQAKKHWIQAMLNEETWIPFDVTYDVTAWSNPLLMNLDGGWTGELSRRPRPSSRRSPQPTWELTADRDLDVLLLETDRSTRGYESAGQPPTCFATSGASRSTTCC